MRGYQVFVDPPFATRFRAPLNMQQGPIQLRGFDMRIEEVRWTQSNCSLRVTVPDRDTRLPLELNFNVSFDHAYTPDQLAERLVKTIANIFAHEVAEMLFVDGQRFDPHTQPVFFRAEEPLPDAPTPVGQLYRFGFKGEE